MWLRDLSLLRHNKLNLTFNLCPILSLSFISAVMLGGRLHELYLHMLIVVKLKELICKCVITHQKQQREGANYKTGALGVKLCPGHAIKLFLSGKRQEGMKDTNQIRNEEMQVV